MDSIIKKLVGDLVKGAAQTEGFVRGSRMRVDFGGDLAGQKIANHAALGAGLGGLLLPGLGAPIGAAIGADKGQGLSAAGGTLLGGLGGSAAGGLGGAGLGALIGALAGNPALGATIGGAGGAGLGGIGGALYGAHRGGEKESLSDKISAAADRGVKAATARFGIKEAFLPLLGSLLGGGALRAGVGALARGAGGRALGGIAGKMLPRMTGGIGGAATDMVGSMAGSAIGQRMMPQQQPQQPMGMMG